MTSPLEQAILDRLGNAADGLPVAIPGMPPVAYGIIRQ